MAAAVGVAWIAAAAALEPAAAHSATACSTTVLAASAAAALVSAADAAFRASEVFLLALAALVSAAAAANVAVAVVLSAALALASAAAADCGFEGEAHDRKGDFSHPRTTKQRAAFIYVPTSYRALYSSNLNLTVAHNTLE